MEDRRDDGGNAEVGFWISNLRQSTLGIEVENEKSERRVKGHMAWNILEVSENILGIRTYFKGLLTLELLLKSLKHFKNFLKKLFKLMESCWHI